MSSARGLNPHLIDQIIWQLHPFISNRRIAKIVHVGQDRVHDVLRAYQRGQILEHEMGRPKKVTPAVMARIVSLSLSNGHLSDQMVADAIQDEMHLQISRTTVNEIRHSQRFDYGPPRKCPQLNEEHIQLRRQFVRDWREGALFRQLKQLPLVFSDESRFSFGGSDNGYTWSRRGEYLLSNMNQKPKYPPFSIMVWGAIGPYFKSPLIICDGTINSEVYINFLKNQFFTYADLHFGHYHWLFMQDGASCHTSTFSLNELCKYCVTIPFWPPNSPDLNPIEVVWGIMKRRLKADGIRTRNEAVQVLLQEWDKLTFGTINGLVNSFETRVQMVEQADGQTIQPLLSANKNSVPAGYLPDRPVVPLLYPWTEAEDQRIRQLIEEYATSGKTPVYKQLAARFFPTRDPRLLKNRWKVLKTKKLNEQRDDFLSAERSEIREQTTEF
jgi:transposase